MLWVVAKAQGGQGVMVVKSSQRVERSQAGLGGRDPVEFPGERIHPLWSGALMS